MICIMLQVNIWANIVVMLKQIFINVTHNILVVCLRSWEQDLGVVLGLFVGPSKIVVDPMWRLLRLREISTPLIQVIDLTARSLPHICVDRCRGCNEANTML